MLCKNKELGEMNNSMWLKLSGRTYDQGAESTHSASASTSVRKFWI